MTEDGGWITEPTPIPDRSTVWVWDKSLGRSLIAGASQIAGRPWQPIPDPVEPPPYVEPKAERLDGFLVFQTDGKILYFTTEQSADIHLDSNNGDCYHVREVLSTDIDQDVVAEVRESIRLEMGRLAPLRARRAEKVLNCWFLELTPQTPPTNHSK